ncbi:MAG: hypothetical protein JF593_10675 [Novosphingobium sp.]|nr:hypothetical protein [Novosphingobium sp.]
MTMQFRALAEQAIADGAITPDEILTLRRAGWADGAINRAEAEALFALDHRLGERSPEWVDYFVEAIVEHVLASGDPRGYVDAETGAWLIGQIETDGRIDSAAELELVVKLFERATNAPENLRAFALKEIEQTVLTGTGATRDGGELGPGRITASEVRLLRRLVFAQGSDRPAAVSQREAEMLYRLKDATLGAANDPEWPRLFVQAVGNYLTGFAWHGPLSETRARELESFMADDKPHVGRLFAAMGRSDVRAGFRSAFGKRERYFDVSDEVKADAQVTAEERHWLDAMIGANHQVDALDHALLDFLAEEGGA